MSITLKQLQALSEEFEFDYNEAGNFLAIPTRRNVADPPRRRRSAAEACIDSDSDDDVYTGSKCGKDVKKPRAPGMTIKPKQETPKSEAKKSKGGGRAPSATICLLKIKKTNYSMCQGMEKAVGCKTRLLEFQGRPKQKSIFDIFG